jgi:5-methylcytosine-specific restriction endonuclease McrA
MENPLVLVIDDSQTIRKMAATRTQHVRERAAGRCEYCRLPQKATSVPFEVDHIISRKHGGRTIASNLAIACWYCMAEESPSFATNLA